MSDDRPPFPSLVQLEFRRAKTLCARNVIINSTDKEKQKSFAEGGFAQVATSVGQQAVGRKSGGLKPRESKPFRITARFSKHEREILVAQAEKACLTISEYIRVSVLGPSYASAIDPQKRQLLLDLNRELSRQGNNLNQIAKHLNAAMATPEQGASMLATLTRSLLSTHQIVRDTLAAGRRVE